MGVSRHLISLDMNPAISVVLCKFYDVIIRSKSALANLQMKTKSASDWRLWGFVDLCPKRNEIQQVTLREKGIQDSLSSQQWVVGWELLSGWSNLPHWPHLYHGQLFFDAFEVQF